MCLCALIFSTQIVQAHSLWVSLFESHTHEPGHVLSILGWGHTSPIDDLLSSDTASVSIKEYSLITPTGKKVSLFAPNSSTETKASYPYADILTGDLGLRKIALKKDSQQGTYQVIATSKVGFFTSYKDTNGKQRMATKPIDQLKNVSEIIESFRYTMNAKGFYSIGKWTKPKPVGFDLEIIPTCDMSRVRQGDIVSFDVSFMGTPVNTDSNTIHYMTLTSDTFGGPDGFFLSAYIMNGKTRFRIPSVGHWVANVYISQKTSTKGPLSKLAKKCKTIYSCATVSFTVNP
ncbi:DUF4198 domain-containing protein [Desulfovibrio sp. UCD-KL4C]|uniref:DUF4198 domain-containing protein n=1 Tax=Desulfovibrio sp. UCD-KL4C TaxID=2578120 RepID=UPI0025BA92AA|nr:DUF4198 domain-containing protein [Desulfovibrio sp. UCD-KL4C]